VGGVNYRHANEQRNEHNGRERVEIRIKRKSMHMHEETNARVYDRV